MSPRQDRWRSLIVVIALVAIAAAAGIVGTTPASAAEDPLETLPKSATWLETLNAWRAASDVPAVAENPTWSVGDFNHSKYVVEAGDFGHDEDNGGQYSTPEGITAGANGNVAASGSATKTDRAFVEQWMSAPFHAAGMLDPRLASSGLRRVPARRRAALARSRDARRAPWPYRRGGDRADVLPRRRFDRAARAACLPRR